jgi:hypothetical protein
MDLIRAILLELEDLPAGGREMRSPAIAARLHCDERVVGEHLRLMADGGLITVTDFPETRNSECWAMGITWSGYDFLGAIRSESVWTTVRKKLADVGGGASLEVVKMLATSVVKSRLGLSE